MAYVIATGAVLEAQIRYKLQGQQCINVFHYTNSGEVEDGAAELDLLNPQFLAAVVSNIMPFMTTEVLEPKTRLQWVDPVRYVYKEYNVTGDANIPASAPPTLSIGTSVVLKRLTERAGASHRGRIFVSGLPTNTLNIGTWLDTAWGTIHDTMAPSLMAQLTTVNSNYTPIVWSYTDRAGKDVVTQTDADPYARYQRRREVGRGI